MLPLLGHNLCRVTVQPVVKICRKDAWFAGFKRASSVPARAGA
jgi:hypothetical protein